MLSEIVSNFDVFGQPVEILIHNKNRYRTFCGGATSIVLMILFTFVVQQEFIDLLSRNQMQVSQQQILDTQPIIEGILLNNFMLGVQLKFYGTTKLVKNLDYMLVQKKCTSEDDCKNLEFNLEECAVDSFPPQFQSSLVNIQIDNYYCLPKDFNSTIDHLTSVGIQISAPDCTQNSESDCLNKLEQIKGHILEIRLLVTDNLLNPFLEASLSPFVNQYFRYPLKALSQQPNIELYIQRNIVQDDKSLLPFFTEIYEMEQLSVSTEESMNKIVQYFVNQKVQIDNSFKLAYINIQPSWKSIVVKKSYYRFDQLMAYLGGLMKIVIFIFSVALVFYNRFSLYVFLANKLYTFNVPLLEKFYKEFEMENKDRDVKDVKVGFSFDLISQKIKNRILRVQKIIEGLREGNIKVQKPDEEESEFKSEKFIRDKRRDAVMGEEIITRDQLDRGKFLDGAFNDLLSLDTGIKMAFSYLFYIFFCKKFIFRRNIQVQLIDKAVEMISQEIDILVIMDKMHEIEKLKKLLLTETQIKVFNYTPKPVIRAEKLENKKTISFKQQQSAIPVSERQLSKQVGCSTFQDENVPTQIKKLQDRREKFDSKEAFQKLYQSYFDLTREVEQTRKKHHRRMNLKLMDLLGSQIIEIFETSSLLFDNKEKFIEYYYTFCSQNERYIEQRKQTANGGSISQLPRQITIETQKQRQRGSIFDGPQIVIPEPQLVINEAPDIEEGSKTPKQNGQKEQQIKHTSTGLNMDLKVDDKALNQKIKDITSVDSNLQESNHNNRMDTFRQESIECVLNSARLKGGEIDEEMEQQLIQQRVYHHSFFSKLQHIERFSKKTDAQEH